MSNSICEDCGLPFVICQAVGSVRMALKYRDAGEVAEHVLPLLSDQADLRAIQAERDELRTAIFGSPDYATDLRNGNFREMAETLHAARAGGVARAEAAEATVATLTAQVEAMRGALDRIAAGMGGWSAAELARTTLAALETAQAVGVEATNSDAGDEPQSDAAAKLATPQPGEVLASSAPAPAPVDALAEVRGLMRDIMSLPADAKLSTAQGWAGQAYYMLGAIQGSDAAPVDGLVAAVDEEIAARHAYEELPADRGGRYGPKGSALAAWQTARAKVITALAAIREGRT